MIVFAHVVIALTSVAYTAYVFFRPSGAALRLSYVLVAGTIASGTMLVLSTSGHILETCLMGLLYTGVTFYCIASARNKLAPEKVTKR